MLLLRNLEIAASSSIVEDAASASFRLGHNPAGTLEAAALSSPSAPPRNIQAAVEAVNV